MCVKLKNSIFSFKIKVMEINWGIIAVVAVIVLVIVIITIRKNQREKKKLTDLLNNDFTKTEESDVNADDAANEK